MYYPMVVFTKHAGCYEVYVIDLKSANEDKTAKR